MKQNTVTQAQIADIISRSVITDTKMGDKTTLAHCKLPSGFEIIESSSCVDPANYDHDMGKKICLERITNRLWMLEGYLLQNINRLTQLLPKGNESLNFGQALAFLKNKNAVQREDWNGKGLKVIAQFPDAHSKMSLPYLYIEYPDGKRCPWLASQTDIMAEDWKVL